MKEMPADVGGLVCLDVRDLPHARRISRRVKRRTLKKMSTNFAPFRVQVTSGSQMCNSHVMMLLKRMVLQMRAQRAPENGLPMEVMKVGGGCGYVKGVGVGC